ncbi:hypothetical protein [Dokdonia sp.]|uniref:hypothetical protein n=1 Tax=Dokdonia sp. TaxID=2024995 RepID=UPI00326621B6
MNELISKIFTIPILFEIVAALAATITYKFFKDEKNISFKFLCFYLWLVAFIDVMGAYPYVIYYYNYDELAFFIDIDNKKWLKNYWIFNILIAIAYIFYSWYFREQLYLKKHKKILKYSIYIYTIFCVLYSLYTPLFFDTFLKLNNLFGLLLLTLSIAFYYYELLRSDKILSIGYSLPFYISIATLLWYISVTPLVLSSEFLVSIELVFLEYYRLILNYANYFLYGIITFGIIRCYWLNKSQNTKSFSSSTLS